MLVETTSGPTWHRYVDAIRPWFTHAAAASPPFPALPADPVRFASWLASAGAEDRGYAQTKARCAAISALCQLVGAPSPESHHLVQAVREAAWRTKRFRRGSVAHLFRRESPPLPGSPPNSLTGFRLGLSPRARYRQRTATVRHMALQAYARRGSSLR